MKFLILVLMLIPTGLVFADTGDVTAQLSSEPTVLTVGNQIMITADVSNNQNTQQSFAYLTQVKNEHQVVISLSWLTGSLSPRQSFSPAQSWTSAESGLYTIEVFVWKGIDDPEALSPPLSMTVKVVDPDT
ncbi:MAG: hypothetical protein K8Q89_09690 [Nitrosarchaeum sp.]|nr:hypothetical protein [Nitrosarchaeum sp.]